MDQPNSSQSSTQSSQTTWDIFELLGITNLAPEERNSFLARMTHIVTERALVKAVQEGKISEAQQAQLEEMTKRGADSVEIQKKIVEIYPEIIGKATAEAEKFKAEALVSQIDDFIKFAQTSLSPDDLVFAENLRNRAAGEKLPSKEEIDQYNAMKTRLNFKRK